MAATAGVVEETAGPADGGFLAEAGADAATAAGVGVTFGVDGAGMTAGSGVALDLAGWGFLAVAEAGLAAGGVTGAGVAFGVAGAGTMAGAADCPAAGGGETGFPEVTPEG